MIGKLDYIGPKPGYLITHKGKVDLDKLYKEGKKWFDYRQYQYNERKQIELVKPQGNEVRFDWVANRKVDDYVKFHITAFFFILEVNKFKGVYKANVKINIKAFLELDYRGNWSRNFIGHFLFFIYNNFVIKKKIEGGHGYEDRLYDEVLEYMGLLKKILNLPK